MCPSYPSYGALSRIHATRRRRWTPQRPAAAACQALVGRTPRRQSSCHLEKKIMLSHRTKIYSMIKKIMHVHVQYLDVLHDGVNMSVTTVHMVLSIIWRVLNWGSCVCTLVLYRNCDFIPVFLTL